MLKRHILSLTVKNRLAGGAVLQTAESRSQKPEFRIQKSKLNWVSSYTRLRLLQRSWLMGR